MRPIVLLGSTGMIGSAVARHLTQKFDKIIEVNRSGLPVIRSNTIFKFDIENQDTQVLCEVIPENALLINLTGVIRHKISDEQTKKSSKIVNSEFPKVLSKSFDGQDIRILQIATDCVFSGIRGNYSEHSIPDPIDEYGLSKAEGEMLEQNLLTLRVSVIGKELRNHVELMDWVLTKPKNDKVIGYTNHFWNGITSLHFAKLVCGIVENNLEVYGTYHVVPRDKVSKFELVNKIAAAAGRNDLKIEPQLATSAVDRTLITANPEFNSMLWKLAGYEEPPSINEMIDEYFRWANQ